jgi:hypothetical protein
MSAMADLVIQVAERVSAESGADFDDVMSRLLDGEIPGYICKLCGEPSPIGVGYVTYDPDAYLSSFGRQACPCGYSELP